MNWLIDIAKAPGRWLADLSPNCRKASRLQSEALDRKLPFRQRLGLRIHLFLCKWCRRYGKQLSFLCHAAHDHADEATAAAPQSLSSAARDRIKQKLRAEQE